MCDLPYASMKYEPSDSFLDEFLFLISTIDPWYGDLLIYLQTQWFQPHLSHDDHHRIHHHAKYYLILNDTSYRHGIDSILQQCLTHEEVEHVLNDFHSRACGGHLSGMATAQKILRAGYFWPSIFKDYHETVKKCPPCNIFIPKSAPILLRFTPSFLLALFPNGGWTSYIVSLPQLGGMVTSS